MHGNSSARGFWGLLSGEERAALTALSLTRDFPPGVTMCHEGDPATHLYVLVDVVGELAGEMSGHRTATLQAIDLVHALIVGYERFTSFLDANPGAARAYRHEMTQRWGDAADLLRRHPLTSGAQRLAALLLELAGRHGTVTGGTGDTGGQIDVAMPLSQQELANLAGTSRATVARAFKSWRDRGFVRTGQKHITITNPQRLRQIADQRA